MQNVKEFYYLIEDAAKEELCYCNQFGAADDYYRLYVQLA